MSAAFGVPPQRLYFTSPIHMAPSRGLTTKSGFALNPSYPLKIAAGLFFPLETAATPRSSRCIVSRTALSNRVSKLRNQARGAIPRCGAARSKLSLLRMTAARLIKSPVTRSGAVSESLPASFAMSALIPYRTSGPRQSSNTIAMDLARATTSGGKSTTAPIRSTSLNAARTSRLSGRSCETTFFSNAARCRRPLAWSCSVLGTLRRPPTSEPRVDFVTYLNWRPLAAYCLVASTK